MFYEISANGTVFGLFEGEDEQEARDACARDMGYEDEAGMECDLDEPSALEAREVELFQPQSYCTQPRRHGETCWDCSLASYGKDCENNPIAPLPDEEDVETQAEVAARYEKIIPEELRERFPHLTYGEMADRTECQAYAADLRDLEQAWWRAWGT